MPARMESGDVEGVAPLWEESEASVVGGSVAEVEGGTSDVGGVWASGKGTRGE